MLNVLVQTTLLYVPLLCCDDECVLFRIVPGMTPHRFVDMLTVLRQQGRTDLHVLMQDAFDECILGYADYWKRGLMISIVVALSMVVVVVVVRLVAVRRFVIAHLRPHRCEHVA